MSDRFPQYSLSQFPNSLDSYLIFQDVNISNKPLVDQYYSYINENDFASATQLIEDNPSLKYVIVTANTMQSIYDALMAIETTYSTDVIKTIATCVTSQGEWSSTGSYPIFSIVTSRGTAFMCIKPDCPIGTPVTDTNYWITMTMRGESGTSMSFHESYDSTFPYGIQDCVPFANRLYVSITNDNLGNQPDISPDFWSAVISVPTQTIISKNQPTGQDSNGLWYKTNDTNNSYEVNKSNGDNTYSPLFPTSKASYIKTSDGQTIDTALKSNSDLITEHKADTNNPHQVTAEQVGAVQGNTKAWVATEATAGDSWATDIVVPNFLFSEGCTVTYKAPQSPTESNPAWANRLQIRHESGGTIIGVYTLSTLNKEPLPADIWTTGAMVTVTLSNEVVSTWSNLPTAFFKGGSGSLKEMFTFPLSIQTAEPTPVDTNHIWIKNDTKMPFAIDEAIRASDWGGDNRYYGIVDSTDTNYMQFEGPKKLTDGSAIGMTNRHIGKDATSWNLGVGEYAKKYGKAYYANNQSKWPRIYSRINGTIDMEDAYRWNGSAWYPLSQKGSYLFGYSHDCRLYNNAGGILSPHSDIIGSTWINDAEFSRDGQFLCIIKSTSTDSDMIHLFSRTGDSFNEVSVPYNITGYKYWVCFTPDSQYMIIGSTSSGQIYKRNGNSFSLLKTLADAGISTGFDYQDSNNMQESDIGFTHDGKFFIEKNSNTIEIYNWANESFSLKQEISTPSALAYSRINSVRICKDADMFLITPYGSGSSDYNVRWGRYVYESVNGQNFNLIYSGNYYGSEVGTQSYYCNISPTGKYLAYSYYDYDTDPAGGGLTILQRQSDNSYIQVAGAYGGAYLMYSEFMSDNYLFTTSGGKDVHVLKFNGSSWDQTTYFDTDKTIFRLTSLNFN